MMILTELDKPRMEWWQSRAASFEKKDIIFSFISYWIAFNYYYSTFSSENKVEFNKFLKKKHWRNGDKSQWLFLIQDKRFTELISAFRKTLPPLILNLPIISIRDEKKVPEGKSGNTEFKELSDEEIFSVLYQIRNNLFHGSKDPSKNERDKKLCAIGVEFLRPFISELLSKTYK